MIDSGRLGTALEGASDRMLRRGAAVARAASARDFRLDWGRWTPAERFLAVAIMAGFLIEFATLGGLGGR